MEEKAQAGAGRRRRHGTEATQPLRRPDYRTLRNPFPVARAFSDDRIAAMHEAALTLLQEHGMRVLLPEARAILAGGGALVDEDAAMVRIGRDIVAAALAAAPRSIACRGAVRDRDVTLATGRLVFQPGAGAPHASDLDRGRRPATARDFRELVRIAQHFDVLQMLPPLVEPQDVAPHLRHYLTMETMLARSDKLPFVYARGRGQVMDSFAMLRDFRGLGEAAFTAASHCYTVINTNSPRQLDAAMAEGLIDFARAGQVAIVTPFPLMGAMAPVTVAGAVTLGHAEALAAITLAELACPGAPVVYGSFTSNVDMRSGAPAFGTPEHFRATLAAGQLARLIDLPWRSATGTSANVNDAQAAHETQFALWGCLLAGATVVIHAAGWLEGGLTVSYEKLITDLEVVQMVAELCAPEAAGAAEIALQAIAEVPPGGHFFAADHTLERYRTAFYPPLVADRSNFGTWSEQGAPTASMRATGVWKAILAEDRGPVPDEARLAALQAFIARRTAAGGAPPLG